MISIIKDQPGNGGEYHRQIAPLKYLGEKSTHAILLTNGISQWTEEEVKAYKTVQFQWLDEKEIYPIFRKLGMKVWYDIDDMWELETRHPLFNLYKFRNMKGRTQKLLTEADVVTTPNERLCDMASSFNKNVHLLKTFINPNEEQFIPRPRVETHRIHFGWIGAKFHVEDVALLKSGIDKLYADHSLNDKYRVVYGGFIDNDPHCLQIQSYLMNGSDSAKQHFSMFKAAPVERYAGMYNHIHVALAPLEDTRYNNMKSELKIIEAGHFGIPVIASDVYPYNEVIEHGVDGFLVKKNKGHKDWYKYMKMFINDPALVNYMGSKLRDKVNERFNPDTITQQRIQILDAL